MRERKLDEAFEESLAAYLEKGRSVEDSLRLYPQFREELEPLLRTALQVSESFQAFSPPPAVQERGLARFLSDARGRAHLNGLRDERQPGWFGRFFAAPERLGLVAAGVAVVALAIAVGMATLGGDADSGEPERVNAPRATRPPVQGPGTPASVLILQDTIRAIRDRVSDNETVAPSEVEALSNAVRQLSNDDKLDPEERNDTIDQLQLAEVLDTLVAAQPELAPQVEETRVVAGIGGGTLPTPIVEPPATTVTDPTAPPTSGPTPPPTPPPTPEPTPVPTEAPTPVPTAPAESRVPGFVPIP